ncbi:MAG: VTT domain-containing protein, partial [Lacunisphaera sp.]
IATIILIIAIAGGGFWWLKIHDFNVWLSIEGALADLRAAGPLPFFAAMAILPAVGFPISLFYLAAASAFATQMGLEGVIAASGAAILVDLAISYWLVRYGLRPWLERLIGRTKYKIPLVAAANQVQITWLVRITPGPPYVVQNVLLGLAEIPFFTFLWISWLTNMLYACGFIIFGDAIIHGKGEGVLFGVGALVAVAVVMHFVRVNYGKKGK